MSSAFHVRACVILVVIGHTFAMRAAASTPTVALEARKTSCLLGEPLLFKVAVTNRGQNPLPTWVDALSSQVEIHARPPAGEFVLIEPGSNINICAIPDTRPLAPGNTKVYERRVLCSVGSTQDGQKAAWLLLDRPGRWQVKAVYPTYPNREMIESNVIEIEIQSPEGVDADVWNFIRRDEVLCFLQLSLVWREYPDLPTQIVRLMQAVPESKYAPVLRDALERYHEKRRLHFIQAHLSPDAEFEMLSKALGKPEGPQGPFVEDRRLDAQVRLHFPGDVRMPDALADLSRQSGVPLRASPAAETQRETISGGQNRVVPLRQFMRWMDGPTRTWVREADGGYMLIPLAEPPRRRPPAPPAIPDTALPLELPK